MAYSSRLQPITGGKLGQELQTTNCIISKVKRREKKMLACSLDCSLARLLACLPVFNPVYPLLHSSGSPALGMMSLTVSRIVPYQLTYRQSPTYMPTGQADADSSSSRLSSSYIRLTVGANQHQHLFSGFQPSFIITGNHNTDSHH